MARILGNLTINPSLPRLGIYMAWNYIICIHVHMEAVQLGLGAHQGYRGICTHKL